MNRRNHAQVHRRGRHRRFRRDSRRAATRERRRRRRPSRATTRSAISSRSRSPGPMTSRSAPAPIPSVSGARVARSCSSGRWSRSRATSCVIHPEEQHGWFHFGWRRAARRDFIVTVPQLARRDHRRVGRHQGRPGAAATASKARSPDRAGSARVGRGAVARSCRSAARAASRPAPARPRAPNMTIAGSGDIDAGAVAAAAGQGLDRRLGQRQGACDRHRRRRHHGLGRRRRHRRRQVHGQQGRLGQRPLLLKRALNHDRRKVRRMRTFLIAAALRSRLAAPAGAATRNFGITSFEKVRVDGPFRVTLDDRRRAVRPGDRLAGRARPGRDRRRAATRSSSTATSSRGAAIRARTRAGRDQPRHARPQRGLAERLGRARDRPGQGPELRPLGPGLGRGRDRPGRRRSAERQRRSAPASARLAGQAGKADRRGPRHLEPRCRRRWRPRTRRIGAEGAATIDAERQRRGRRSTRKGPATIRLTGRPACTLRVSGSASVSGCR